MLSEALVLPPHSPGCWGKVSWVVNSVRLALPFPSLPWQEETRPSPRWQPISKWGQEYFEVVTALTRDLTLRDATKLFNFLTFPDIEKEAGWWVTNINGVLNPVCFGSCLSFRYSESNGNYRASSGEETVWLPFSFHFYYQTSALASWRSRLFLCLVCVCWKWWKQLFSFSTLVEQAGFLWWKESICSSQTLGISFIIRG